MTSLLNGQAVKVLLCSTSVTVTRGSIALSARAQLAMTSNHLEETLEFGRRALDLAARFDDHGVRTHALNNIGSARAAAGDRSGLAELEESIEIASGANAIHATALLRRNLPG